MSDLPPGPALLALARDVLLRDLLPLLPQEAQLEARLVASSMAIAEREAAAGEELAQEILGKLEKLYGEAGGAKPGLLERLARDLRHGILESSELREILWRLTIAKLRSSNPRFLNANGFN